MIYRIRAKDDYTISAERVFDSTRVWHLSPSIYQRRGASARQANHIEFGGLLLPSLWLHEDVFYRLVDNPDDSALVLWVWPGSLLAWPILAAFAALAWFTWDIARPPVGLTCTALYLIALTIFAIEGPLKTYEAPRLRSWLIWLCGAVPVLPTLPARLALVTDTLLNTIMLVMLCVSLAVMILASVARPGPFDLPPDQEAEAY